MLPPPVEPFPICRVADLAAAALERRWLIEPLWAAGGVGVIGGAPKSCKSWLGLEMAVSVASGTPCLGSFPARDSGPVLLYMAEDANEVVRERIESLCRLRSLPITTLDLFCITVGRLRIDRPVEQARLRETIALVRPRMLLLDPLVRLHSVDENRADEISALLAYLRALQREFDTAVVLVHHTRKSGASGQPGQALRGSGDLHAFGDSNLYLRRQDSHLTLTVEHRAAPSPPPVLLDLVGAETPHLAITSCAPTATAPGADLDQAVLDLLRSAEAPLTRSTIRGELKARNERVGETLTKLEQRGAIERTAAGWQAANHERSRSHPIGSPGTERPSTVPPTPSQGSTPLHRATNPPAGSPPLTGELF